MIPEQLSLLTIAEMKTILKHYELSYCFKDRKEYIKRIMKLKKLISFPWREDQDIVLRSFLQHETKYFVINGIFGCGKTTLLIGMMINAILKKKYKTHEMMFISFNVCIRNELQRKLREFGYKSKIKVRTFDSIIYEICKLHNYKYLDLPNFDGKRRFVYDLCNGEHKDLEYQPKVIFIDEVQDLEKQTLNVFKTFFKDARIIFAGDVFQSIQKEPRESLLWHMLNDEDGVSKYYMKQTPRVPKSILLLLKTTLTSYYPEFTDEISQWKSLNTKSKSTIEWNRFYGYSQLFDICENFVNKYDEKKCMILTFSSAITVKGALGDLSRLRNRLLINYELNTNHKKLESDKLFLSTANSSKGLERDYVLVILTFPLERAFANFSNDLVMNLITVAVTRAKRKVIFYVPAYNDKYSIVLNHFTDCPRPNKEKIREGKGIHEYQWKDYMNIETGVTELIRQSIIKYDTRIKIKEFTKRYQIDKLFDAGCSSKLPIAVCEEQKAFVGIVIENLITSTWSRKWPPVIDDRMIKTNPMYTHCLKRIETALNKYKKYIRRNSLDHIDKQFEGVYLYSQLHVAIYNKLFMGFSETFKNVLKVYWSQLKGKIVQFRPKNKMTAQTNLRMPWLTGIADVIEENKTSGRDGKEFDDITIWEIKASIDYQWKDDALTQALMYSLMTGKAWSRIILINPFRNERVLYYFDSKTILTLRNLIYTDILTWNMNCYLSKTTNVKNPVFNTHNKLFTCLTYCDDVPSQLVCIEFLSPTKIFVKENTYFYHDYDAPDTKFKKLMKQSSITYSEDYISKYSTYDIVTVEDLEKECLPDDYTCISHDYCKTLEDQTYELNFDDALVKLIVQLSNINIYYKYK